MFLISFDTYCVSGGNLKKCISLPKIFVSVVAHLRMSLFTKIGALFMCHKHCDLLTLELSNERMGRLEFIFS